MRCAQRGGLRAMLAHTPYEPYPDDPDDPVIPQKNPTPPSLGLPELRREQPSAVPPIPFLTAGRRNSLFFLMRPLVTGRTLLLFPPFALRLRRGFLFGVSAAVFMGNRMGAQCRGVTRSVFQLSLFFVCPVQLSSAIGRFPVQESANSCDVSASFRRA
jgi:hypothetical protein